jgi:tryptophan synthase beta chain
MSGEEFAGYGDRHVPESPEEPLAELADAYDEVGTTESFRTDLRAPLEAFAGRPTSIFHAETLGERYGADIYLKREDLLHGGADKINDTLGQALLAKRAGTSRPIAETGAGQYGTATAMASALLDLDTEIYMGKKDVERQKTNLFRMRLMGATVNEVTRGGAGLADAVDAALEDMAANVEDTHYLVGSVVGPDPFPRMVRDFQSSSATRRGNSCATGSADSPTRRWPASVAGPTPSASSIPSATTWPSTAPRVGATGRAEYTAITDDEALATFRELAEAEGIVPALESSHGLALAIRIAEECDHDTILENLSGRGDKDMETAATQFGP